MTDRLSESFLSGSSSVYAEEMYEAWKRDPKRWVATPMGPPHAYCPASPRRQSVTVRLRSVHASWDAYFRNVAGGAEPGQVRSPLR